MQPEDTANQDYTEDDGNDEYYGDDYYPTAAEREVELLKQQLAEAYHAKDKLAHQLAESERIPPGRPRKKKSSQRTQTAVTETTTIQTEAQARTIAAGETQTQATNVPAPQGPRQPPSPIRAPPSPIRHPEPEQLRNNPAPPANNSRGSRGNKASNQDLGAHTPEQPHSNQQNRPMAHPVQPRQHNMPSSRMGNNGPRPLPQNNHRARTHTYREASV